MEENTLQVVGVSVTPMGLCVKLQGIRPPGGSPSTPAKEAGDPASSIKPEYHTWSTAVREPPAPAGQPRRLGRRG